MQEKFRYKFNLKSFLPYVIVVLLSGIWFCLIYGTRILNPTYVDWLYSSNTWSDPTIHYLGWKAYRNSPWTFPIGLTNNLIYPEKSSVIFTDSLPLLAVVFKIIAPVLPVEFQFSGIYHFFSLIAVGILVIRILESYSDNKAAITVSVTFFLLSPMLLKSAITHVALFSHWLLLLALEPIFVRERFYECKAFYKRCLLLGVLVPSIHLYYVPMCGICLLGYSVADLSETKRLKKQVIALLAYILPCFLIILLLGGFYGNFSPTVSGDEEYLGKCSFNLISMFNPVGGWSSLLREHSVIYPYQLDGYLGMGVLLLGFAVCILLLKTGHKGIAASLKKNHFQVIGILVSSILAVFIALSPVISFGSHIICTIPLPKLIYDAWAVFRATSRFIWIVEYVIILLCCIIVSSELGKKEVVILLLFCVAVQGFDFKDKIHEIHSNYSNEAQKDLLITDSEFWGSIANDKRIDEVVITTYMSGNQLYSITDWSIDNGLKQNFFLFARRPGNEIWQYVETALDNPTDAQIFIFTEGNRNTCGNYNLNYYEVDGYIIGYVGELNTGRSKMEME